jgi:glycosyltransferase involved in cell wall biosynthesis
MPNHYKIVVPLYNVEKWIDKCIKSIKLQEYQDYECYLVDDISTDNTSEIIQKLIKNDSRFHYVKNTEKKYALKNIYEAIKNSGNNPEDIIVTLDGDDWFATKKALNILNKYYDTYRCYMTYGSYLEYPSMKKGNFCQKIPENIIKNNNYRKNRWVSSHLRTFKRHLWNKIDLGDLHDDNGDFYRMTWDMAFMFPMLEMSGPLAIHVPETIYAYNRQNPLNDDKVNHSLQLQTEQKIRNKSPYEQSFVTCDILGPGPANSGLGNQLFCIAATLSYARDNNKIPVFPEIKTKKQIKKYSDVFYRLLNIGLEGDIHYSKYNEIGFSYNKIPSLEKNTKLHGYFQSYKYFKDYRKELLENFSIPELQKKVIQKYGNLSDETSMHVRRGDYCNLQDYHSLLKLEYYKKAISVIGENEKYVVFSDDLEWCKKNITFVKNIKFFSCERDWEEMLLMSTCKNNIIANSTFSWWSAWLNCNKDKIIIAPNNWFGESYSNKKTEDLIPNEWKRI